ncbi:MAG: class SAM-dependent methyltransferase [Anaerocolumna sp.]|jgi:cyclopropane fatty-acyl-phospholipid synthase-like methyltransferase|nr:class SAM-dependent methyltransferase [Anaerocolumna sp.]
MQTKIMKSNLRDYYNKEAPSRNLNNKDEWKISQRSDFCNLIKSENKTTLLEIGAGTGDDSVFYMKSGLEVIAVDLSPEMVRICIEKSIKAYELDFYNLVDLNNTFDCIWSMNSLLHVPKSDLPKVLKTIDSVLNKNGLFYMGVYGGLDLEHYYIDDFSDIPRLFSFYNEQALKDVLSYSFNILSYQQIDVGRKRDFQAVIMRKK